MANNAPIGTKAVGYAGPENGPFNCAHCVHFGPPRFCNHPDVVADKELRKTSNQGTLVAIVSPQGCCNEFRPHKQVADKLFTELGV